jgi:uncharacterized protein (DUF427 family)
VISFYSAVQKISRDRDVTRESFAYIPREDVKMSLLERTDRQTYCPYKGECSYSSIPAGGALIGGYIAFYPDRVDEMGESPTV